MPLGDTYPTPLTNRRMQPGGGPGWENIFGSNEPTIPQNPSTFGIPGTLGANVRQGPFEDIVMGAHKGGGGGGGLAAPASPVPSLNQIIAQSMQAKPLSPRQK